MGQKRKTMEDEMSRFEAEISKPTSNHFVPSQVARSHTVIGSNTYSTVQQRLSSSIPPPPIPPSLPPFLPPPSIAERNNYTTQPHEPTPAIVSSAPKLYSRPSVSVNVQKPESMPAQPSMIDIASIQFEVSNKIKKLKSSDKPGPNPIAEEAIKAAKASAALQSFGNSQHKGGKKDKKTVRVAGGQQWEDPSLADWSDDDFRIFAGDLGNDVNDELLTRTFNKYPSFQKAKVVRDKRTNKSKGYGFVSFKDPQDFIRAMKEMDGRYVGSRPIKLRKSTWRNRSVDVVRKKDREKQALLSLFNKN